MSRNHLIPTEKRILVTGGAGFIGSHICRRLLDQGHDVVCADNLFTGRKRNIVPLLENPDFEFIRHDVTFPLFLEVDEIFNLACPASPNAYQHDSVQTVKTSVHGAINMLGLAKRVGARILQASTSEVYGDPAVHPQREDYWGNVNPIGPRACYDEGKRCAETLFVAYAHRHRLDTRIARIFNTFGPGMHPNDGRVVSNFIVQALLSKPLSVYGDGTQTRSFCYVDDLVDGLLRLMAADLPAQPVNLGNPAETTVLELAEHIRDLVGCASQIEIHERPQDDPVRRCPDIGRARSALGWEPTTPLQEGLRHTIEYFDALLGGRIASVDSP